MKAAILIAMACISIQAASADTFTFTDDGKTTHAYTNADITIGPEGRLCSQANGPVTTVTATNPPYSTPKVTFKQKHPKIYAVARKTRTCCVFMGPIVAVGANVAVAIAVIF